MRHLIFGASGQIGGAIYTCALEKNLDAVGTWCSQPGKGLRKVDVTDRARVFKLVKDIHPDVIYACAALTNVDRCESDPKESYRINVVGTANLVEAANRIGARLVLISSDYIFDGAKGPYDESDLPNPLNVYGYHKLICEQHVASCAEEYLIVRTTVVYGWEKTGKNFVARLIHKLSQKQRIKVPSDQIGTPTYNKNFGKALLELVDRGEMGVYNLAGATSVDRFNLALAAAHVFGLDGRLIAPAATEDLKQKARRPLKAGLKLEKAREVLSTKLLGYEDGLKQMLKDEL